MNCFWPVRYERGKIKGQVRKIILFTHIHSLRE